MDVVFYLLYLFSIYAFFVLTVFLPHIAALLCLGLKCKGSRYGEVGYSRSHRCCLSHQAVGSSSSVDGVDFTRSSGQLGL